jgi:hypothetical protein
MWDVRLLRPVNFWMEEQWREQPCPVRSKAFLGCVVQKIKHS